MQNPDNLIRLNQGFNEKTTAIVIMQFLDEDSTPVVPASATWSLYDKASGATVNGRSAVPVPTSGATGTIELTPLDNQILDNGKDLEEHRLFVQYTYAGTGTRTGSVEIQIPVINIRIIT